jgi:DNA-binding IclR family transcriptional regulator
MFMRAIADLDAPHIRILAMMANEPAQFGAQSGSPFHAGWSPVTIAARQRGPLSAVYALMSTLEAHGLIRAATGSTPWMPQREAYNITAAGRQLLDRLSEDQQLA